ncbi:adenylosuccinate synthase [Bacteroidales bacterium OttesenSCG-928-B11]|nr:adenylosuccinate synthase [Bacteroidales bacterium OttesenSCG-928-C03]MDL2311829.1 adenylosuccinate synthase [Bacteroidales bacterium OttesenSCG-928-B11]MDL2325522.1 adenylosuccinate synthase [Bacteroidales bacterium OttesenSCG-928-A14]
MKIDILLGLQWGDEGKGKVVDLITPNYDIIARFQGGPNAGHSLEFNNIKHVLHIIPSGIFHPEKINVIGNGVVIDPQSFKDEIDQLITMGVDPVKNLHISSKAHLILPSHRLLDAAQEASKGKAKIGSTLKGIGPTYTDKTGRNGLRVGDIISPNFNEKYQKLKEQHLLLLKQYDFDYEKQLSESEPNWLDSLNTLKKFNIIESEYDVNNYLKTGKNILAEGAQGTLLDIDFGSYPFVTSSNTITSGACSGLGIAPSAIGNVIGIVKAYCTRVGSGPFPTELFDEDGETLRKNGFEFGSTTGRPRRCGWLDLVALNYAIMLNGVTEIVLTKADVLSGFDEIKVCTAYQINGKIVDRVPFDNEVEIKPVYQSFKGWNADITQVRNYLELPVELREYIDFIEKETRVKVSIVSVGPDRTASIKK